MKNQQYQINMCSGSLWDKILIFSLPLMASSILQLLFNAADVVVVGRFAGRDALAAVGSNTALINLMVNLFVGLSVGTNVVVARDLGAGNTDGVRHSVHTAVTMAAISGVALMVFGVTMVRQILVWMSSPTDIIDLATIYLRIYFLGMPALIIYNFGAAILRSEGDTKRPLYFLTAAGIINVCLNLYFVIYLHMSVAGVGLATIISQYISASLVIRCLILDDGPLHLDPTQLTLKWSVVKRILQVGIPAGLQSVVFNISSVIIQSALNSFDSAVIVAGSSVGHNIESFIYTSMNTFYQSVLTFTSQNYGAGQTKRVTRTLFLCLGYVIATGLILGNLAYHFGEQLVSIYAPGEPEVVAWALERMRFIGRLYAICGIMEVMGGALRGIGYSIGPMVIAIMGGCVFRLAWVAVVFPVFNTPASLYCSFPISWALTGMVHATVFLCVHKRAYAQTMDTVRQGF